MRHLKLYFTEKCSSTEKEELQNTIPQVEESEPKRHKGRKKERQKDEKTKMSIVDDL